MNPRICLASVLSALFCLTALQTAAAQAPGEPTTGPAAVVQAGDEVSLYFEVHQVRKKVRVGPIGLDPKTDADWTIAKVGDRITAGQQIHVPFRGRVKLFARPADPPTVLLIESASLVSFAELVHTGDASKSRVKLAYGAVRAGVAEGRVRSDMEIEAPVATLSKKGTDIFRFAYHDGQFRMSLTPQGRGMLRAIQQQATGAGAYRSRSITPGQFITQRMLLAIDHIQFERGFLVNDVYGLGGADQLFTLLNNHGLGFLIPTGSNVINFLDSPSPGGGIGGQPGFDPDQQLTLDQRLALRRLRALRNVAGGDFGIGQGSVPGVFDTQDARAKSATRNLGPRTLRVDRVLQTLNKARTLPAQRR